MSEIPRFGGPTPGDVEEIRGTIDSMPSLGMGELGTEQGVVLKDWSAQDFSNVYVRFRPHLISHARRFLREESQAEEVVQDAFLYLMTALPELDSDLGVLRFLKWKTKMLCLDLIRSSQTGISKDLVPLPDEVADETQPLESLERADDAAIIRLALAKLSPRHREVLIATIYEEKSHEEVARQIGVSENALRQLLFRARAAFKVALIGEADVKGRTFSEILSIAARKNSRTAVKFMGGTAALFIAFGLFSPSGPLSTHGVEIATPSFPLQVTPRAESDSVLQFEEDIQGNREASSELWFIALEPQETGQVLNHAVEEEIPLEQESNGDSVDVETSPLRATFAESLNGDFAQDMARNSNQSQKEFHLEQQTLVIESGPNLTAYLAFDLSTAEVIQHVSLIYSSDLGRLTAVPTNSLATSAANELGTVTLTYVATDFIFGDLGGAFGNVAVEDAPMRKSAIEVNLSLTSSGEIEAAEFSIVPRA